MVRKVVTKSGSMVLEWVVLYKSVVQSGLLYWSESWVVMEAILKVLDGFHHQVARRILEITARHMTSGEW